MKKIIIVIVAVLTLTGCKQVAKTAVKNFKDLDAD